MSGTQINGLSAEVKYFDTIGSYDYTSTDTWDDPEDSLWTLEPDTGEVLALTEVWVTMSEDLIMHDDFIVEFWIDGNPYPVATYTYSDMRDWFSRAAETYYVDYSGPVGAAITGPVIRLIIPFARKPILWSSTGVDAAGNPKLNKMTIRTGDDNPFMNSGGSVPAEVARSRYIVEVYDDPDV